MEKLYTHIINETVHKLINQIYLDYGDVYDFTLKDLQNYYNTLHIEITENEFKLKTNKPKSYKRTITHETCQARVWGDAYMNTKHYRKCKENIKSIDPTQIGKQCHRKALSNNIYCAQHLNKNTHGNFYLMPPKNKLAEYIQHNRHKI